jgi:hypothetical protein
MSLIELVKMISQLIARYLSEERFTGKIIITIHCRDGGIGRASSTVERDLVRQQPIKVSGALVEHGG